MSLRINSEAPDFTAETTQGTIHFHDWIGDGWAILFSHPKDFTPVCTTELGYMAGLKPEFDKRNTKIIGLSVDPVADHARWAKDIEETQGHAVNYPMIGDPELKVAKLYDMLPAGRRQRPPRAAPPPTTRPCARSSSSGPTRRSRRCSTYPMSTGRNFDEVLRLLDSVQLTAKHTVATPVNWKPGEDVIIPPAVSDEQAEAEIPQWLAHGQTLPARHCSSRRIMIGNTRRNIARKTPHATRYLRSLRRTWTATLHYLHRTAERPVRYVGRRHPVPPPGTVSTIRGTC